MIPFLALALLAQDPAIPAAGTPQSYVGQVLVEADETGESTQGSCVATRAFFQKSDGGYTCPKVIVTAAHVIGSKTTATCVIQGKSFTAYLLRKSTERDLAYLLPQPGTTLSYCELPEGAYGYRDTYTAYGYVNGKPVSVASTIKDVGKRFTYAGDSGSSWIVNGGWFNDHIPQGMSGGGVFNARGQLMGIIVAGDDPAKNKTSKGAGLFIPFAIPVGLKKLITP